jgi:RHS repeat-associated protein
MHRPDTPRSEIAGRGRCSGPAGATPLTAAVASAASAEQACGGDESTKRDPRAHSKEIMELPPDTVFYLGDVQQSPLILTNARGSVIASMAYHPYGSLRYATGDSGEPYGFVGNESDRGSGLSDFRARPYRAELGIFLKPDPMALAAPQRQKLSTPAHFALYAYASGDPINQQDATGLEPAPAGSQKTLGQAQVIGNVAQCGGGNRPTCGTARRLGSHPMDAVVQSFLNSRSLDPAFGTVAESIASSSAPEHMAAIIRRRDGSYRLGPLALSGADQSRVTLRFPRLTNGETYAGMIHTHPGRSNILAHSSDVDVPAVRALRGRLREETLRSYVVGGSGTGPHFGVETFEVRRSQARGTLTQLTIPTK